MGDRLAEIRRLAEAATPGPWASEVWYGADDGGWAAIGPHHVDHHYDDGPDGPTYELAMADAAFLAAAREAAPWLLAEVERLMAELAALHEIAELAPKLLASAQELDAEALRIRLALDAMPGTRAPDVITASDRIKYATGAWLAEREEASRLAELCQAAHDALDEAGAPWAGTPAERIRALLGAR